MRIRLVVWEWSCGGVAWCNLGIIKKTAEEDNSERFQPHPMTSNSRHVASSTETSSFNLLSSTCRAKNPEKMEKDVAILGAKHDYWGYLRWDFGVLQLWGHGSMSRLVTKPSFRYFAHWKSDVRQRWQVFTILKTNAATIFFLATLPVVLRTVLGSAISANAAKGTLLRPPHPTPPNPPQQQRSTTCCVKMMQQRARRSMTSCVQDDAAACKRNITLATKSVARRVACKMMRQPASVT